MTPIGTSLRISLVAIALIGLTTACTTPPSPSEAESGSASELPENRAAYREVPLPAEDQRFGTEPEQIALAAFGVDEPSEGNFSQDVMRVDESPAQAVVILTQTGLLDDSVEGQRYWLEFAAGENQWELVWAGRQVRCYPNRGSQEWTTDLCS